MAEIKADTSHHQSLIVSEPDVSDPKPSKSKRLASLDIFRGLTVSLMILVDDAGGEWPVIGHAPWNGCNLADFVMPFFLFIVGMAIALSLKRIPDQFVAVKKVTLRTLKLLFWGLLLQGGYSHAPDKLTYGVDVKEIRWCGILQRIALAYLVVALIEIVSRGAETKDMAPGTFSIFKLYYWHWLVAACVLVIYFAVIYGAYVPDWQFTVQDRERTDYGKSYTVTCGVRGKLDPPCNAVGYIDREVLGISHMYQRPAWKRSNACTENSPYAGPFRNDAPSWCRGPFEPEGIVSSISAILSAIIGVHFGHVLIHMQGHPARLKHWVPTGCALLALGIILHFSHAIPSNKQLYTFSYVCITSGAALRGGGSGNTSPLGCVRSRNTSPSRQKVVKTKPRGLDEETASTFGKPVHPDVQMEDNIWAMLPEDLLNEILARIPPFMIFRLRCVCKRWNTILQDRSFLKFHSQVQSHGPCLLTFWKNSQTPQCSVFSLPLKTWYRIPFAFLPQWAFWLVGSSAGLVCFSGLDGLNFRALVCNPLTQTWRTLPSMHYNQQRQLIMVVDRKDRSFKVIATSDIYGDKSLPTEVYDSKLNTWSIHQIMPAVNLCSSKMAYCDSRLYLETLSPLGLMMYRLDTGYWEHIPAKFPRSLLDGYLVAGTQKRLFLVGRIGLYSTLQSMRIWELDHAKFVWVEISRMPPKYFRSLLRLSAERFECSGQDNLICFTSWNQGKGLLYDVDKKVWSWIAGCALQSYNSQVCFYEPRFDASVY